MAVKKSELYSSLWASCDALRGGMDASQYKDHILEQVRLAVNLHSRSLLIQKRRSHNNEAEAISRLHLI